jgi:hypothetical protein
LDLILCGLVGPYVGKVSKGWGPEGRPDSVGVGSTPNPRAFIERKKALGVKELAFGIGGRDQSALTLTRAMGWSLSGITPAERAKVGGLGYDLKPFELYDKREGGLWGYTPLVKLGFGELSLSMSDQTIYLDYLCDSVSEVRKCEGPSESTLVEYKNFLATMQRKYGLLEEFTLADYVGLGKVL